MPEGSFNLFDIKRAVRENTAAFIALAGPSGSGKTRSALELAVGLAGSGGKILLADTEGRRALHYADLYAFDHVEWRPPYTPENNAALIDLAEKNGYAVLIIDSESDEFEGEGGLQEIKEATKDEFWAKTKTRHKHALINRMRRAKAHIVFCLRAEERVKISKIDGRTVIEPLGWQPICEKRFLYEVQSSFLFDPKRPGMPQPIKLYDIHAQFFPPDRMITREAGEALARWCAGGAPAPVYEPSLETRARDAAGKGKDALQLLWRSLSRDQRAEISYLIGNREQPGELTLLAASIDLPVVDIPNEIPFDAPPSGYPGGLPWRDEPSEMPPAAGTNTETAAAPMTLRTAVQAGGDGLSSPPAAIIPALQAMIGLGDQIAARGIEALRDWWKGLSSSQRGELGARGRGAGPYFEAWAKVANAADANRQSIPERAAVDEPEPKPPEAGRGAAVDGAGSSSEANARLSGGSGSAVPQSPVEAPTDKPVTHGGASGSLAPNLLSGDTERSVPSYADPSPPAGAGTDRPSLEIPMVVFSGKDLSRAWWIALAEPKLRQQKTSDDLAWWIGCNDANLDKARAELGAEEIDAAIAAQWKEV